MNTKSIGLEMVEKGRDESGPDITDDQDFGSGKDQHQEQASWGLEA